jgi:hypothetical protein
MRTYVDFNGDRLDVEVEYRVISMGSKGRYSGPPEDCYPGEGPELDIEAVLLVDEDGKTTDEDILDELSDAALDRLEDRVAEYVIQYES